MSKVVCLNEKNRGRQSIKKTAENFQAVFITDKG